MLSYSIFVNSTSVVFLLLAVAGRLPFQEFKSASDWAAALQYGNNRIHTELRGIYKEMGHTEGVQQEQKWLEEFQELQEESLGSSVPLPLN